MNGEERRQSIVKLIQSSEGPLSGSELALKYNVSRQVIVNDIALIRASNINIISTYKGYIINEPEYHVRTLKVCHPDSEFIDEMNAIIDAGGKIKDVIIDHPVYGKISASLEIYSRNDILKFTQKMQSGNATPLCKITSGIHYHTIMAYSEEILNDVENALKKKGYLKLE